MKVGRPSYLPFSECGRSPRKAVPEVILGSLISKMQVMTPLLHRTIVINEIMCIKWLAQHLLCSKHSKIKEIITIINISISTLYDNLKPNPNKILKISGRPGEGWENSTVPLLGARPDLSAPGLTASLPDSALSLPFPGLYAVPVPPAHTSLLQGLVYDFPRR